MKRTFKTIFCAAAVVMAAVSCQKSAEPVRPAEEGKETIDICVNGLMGEYTQVDATKAELVNTVRVSWKGGETVYVYDGTQCLGSLAASLEGTEDRYAVLSTDGSTHKVSAPVAGTTTLTLVYSPLFTEAPAVNDDAISISLASQSGEKAPFVAYATLDYTGTIITNAVVPFKFATSVIKVNCTGLKPGAAITSATLSNVNTECKLTLSGTTAPSVSGDVNGTITRTGDANVAADNVNEEGVAVFQIAAPKLGEASEARVLTIAQGSDEFEYKNFSKKALSAATSVNTVCQLVKALPAPLPGVFTVDDNGTSEDTSDDVKVHFSKGNLTYNVSTETWAFYEHQYDCATDYDSSLISLFTWGFGTWSTSPNGYDCQTGDFTDWGTAIDDKSTWRTLSNNEWTYLFNNHSKKWASVNGVNGFVIAPDGFSGELSDTYADDAALTANDLVFLPAAGERNGAEFSFVGNRGFYWSSTACGGNNAYHVSFFDDGGITPDDWDWRGCSYSVRLITECQ